MLSSEEVPAILVKLTKLLSMTVLEVHSLQCSNATVTEPGGHLQWDDSDIASVRIEKTDPDICTDALSRLLKATQGQDTRLISTWVSQLPALFRKAGLHCVQYDVREAKPWVALAMHECILVVHDIFASKSKDVAFKQELPELLSRAADETRQGAAFAFTKYIVVGTKVGDA